MTAAAPTGLAADFELILARAAPLWPRLAGKSLFITGGTGFFGRWLLEAQRIANAEHRLGLRVTVLTRDPAAFGRKAPAILADPAFRFVPRVVRYFAFPAGDFTHVIHAATLAHEPSPAKICCVSSTPWSAAPGTCLISPQNASSPTATARPCAPTCTQPTWWSSYSTWCSAGTEVRPTTSVPMRQSALAIWLPQTSRSRYSAKLPTPLVIQYANLYPGHHAGTEHAWS